jgi:hypothetical protein
VLEIVAQRPDLDPDERPEINQEYMLENSVKSLAVMNRTWML